MSIYIAKPYDRYDSGDEEIVIYDNGTLKVYKCWSYYYLCKGELQLAKLISGEEGLKKYYKNDFEVWIDKVRKKDLAKADKFIEEAEKLKETCRFIKEVWERNKRYEE